jgi:type I restriction enzyme M protein
MSFERVHPCRSRNNGKQWEVLPSNGATQVSPPRIDHPDLRADYILANPPFNDSDTALRASAFLQTGGTLQVMAERQDNFRKDEDVRWQPSVARSASSKPEAKLHGLRRQRDIRRALIVAELVDCMVALFAQLFYSTQIPGCLWFCGKNNTLDSANDARLFDGETELSLVA